MQQMTIVAGLDLSLNQSGVVGNGWSQTISNPPIMKHADLHAKATRMLKGEDEILAAVCSHGKPDLVVIEGLAFSKFDAGSATAGFWWMVVGYLTQAGVPVAPVPATTLKKYLLGRTKKGESEKKDVFREVLALTHGTDWDLRDEHQADAWVLWAMGMHHFGSPQIVADTSRLESLGVVPWPEVDLLAQFS